MKMYKLLFKLILLGNIKIYLYSNLFPLEPFSWSRKNYMFDLNCKILTSRLVAIHVVSNNLSSQIHLSGQNDSVNGTEESTMIIIKKFAILRCCLYLSSWLISHFIYKREVTLTIQRISGKNKHVLSDRGLGADWLFVQRYWGATGGTGLGVARAGTFTNISV